MNMDRVQAGINAVTSRSDVMLAVLIVAIIFMIVLPLPTALVDALIATNLTIGIVLLMIAVYIPSPLAFSAFPSVLLITTLFRLALAITTTRLILLQADAGQIIFAFGNFVVAGDFAVGAVIFLIITIVQFMVVTKGAERVAEVSARFSLDAMPGKQMSIDGDMRAGLIDMQEARRRRGLVEKESQLYGAMDGAMKFVKGDAIAGLIITAVNILGGISIATLQRGMTVDEAVQTYSILTIGDGLVAQIPALLIAITAGVIVTRVTTESSINLGTDIGAQVLAQPKAILIAGCLMFGMALVPGFPWLIFVLMGAVLSSLGFVLMQSRKKSVETDRPAPGGALGLPGSAPKRADQGDEFSVTVPLMIEVSSSLEQTLDAAGLNQELVKLRQALYLDLGVPFPGMHLRYNPNLERDSYQILIQETPTSRGLLRPASLLAREEPEALKMLGIAAQTADGFLPGIATLWVPDQYRTAMQKAGLGFLELTQVITLHLAFVLKKNADNFIGIQETRYLLSEMEANYGELVKEVQRVLPIQKIAEIFQRLVSEDISIRNLRVILESLVDWGQKEKDSVLLCEYVRGSLKRYISYKYSTGQNVLPALMLAPDLEDSIRNGIRQTSAGSYLALDPDVTQRFVNAVTDAVGDRLRQRNRLVLVVSMDIRRYVRKLIEQDLYELPVLSYQELTPEISVQPLARIEL